MKALHKVSWQEVLVTGIFAQCPPFFLHFIQPCPDPEDYTGRTFKEAVANPVQEVLTPSILEACINITIVEDLVDEESPEQLQLMLEFSQDKTNINVKGYPANGTILDRCMYAHSHNVLATQYRTI